MSKHRPTPPERREAALRYALEQVLRDAAAWGFVVIVRPPEPRGMRRNHYVNVYPTTR